MFRFITSQLCFNASDTAFSSRSSYIVVLHLYTHHQSNSDKWWSKMTHITRRNDTNYTMKGHTLPHKMVQKVFWSIDNHILFSSNQRNKAQEVYLFFHRKKVYIRLCSHNISPVIIISFLSKKQMIVMKHRTIAWKSSRGYKHFTIENKANKLTLCHKEKAK